MFQEVRKEASVTYLVPQSMTIHGCTLWVFLANMKPRSMYHSISGLVVEYIVAIDVTRVRFPADAYLWPGCPYEASFSGNVHATENGDMNGQSHRSVYEFVPTTLKPTAELCNCSQRGTNTMPNHQDRTQDC